MYNDLDEDDLRYLQKEDHRVHGDPVGQGPGRHDQPLWIGKIQRGVQLGSQD